MVIFHVETHPNFTDYEQCVTYNAFPNKFWESVYRYFGLLMMYLIPLVVILFTYSSILWKIYKKFRDCQNGKFACQNSKTGCLSKMNGVPGRKTNPLEALVNIVCFNGQMATHCCYPIAALFTCN